MFMEQLSFCRKNSQLNVLVSKRFPSDNELMVAVEQRITDGPWGECAPGSWLMPWAAEHGTSGLWMVQSQGSASSLGTILVIAVQAPLRHSAWGGSFSCLVLDVDLKVSAAFTWAAFCCCLIILHLCFVFFTCASGFVCRNRLLELVC